MKVETGLEAKIESLRVALDESTAAARVTNALILAQAMRADLTNPVDAQRVLRYLDSVEKYVGSDSHE